MAIVSYPTDAELPDDVAELLAALPPLNVFRMLANAPANFAPFLGLTQSVLFEAELPAREREIAILRVAHTTHASYEWFQHVKVAQQAGVTDAEIEACGTETIGDALDEKAALAARVGEEISRDVRLSDEALEQSLAVFGKRQTVELILCAAYFNMVSRFLESTRVAIETDEVDLSGAVEHGALADTEPGS